MLLWDDSRLEEGQKVLLFCCRYGEFPRVTPGNLDRHRLSASLTGTNHLQSLKVRVIKRVFEKHQSLLSFHKSHGFDVEPVPPVPRDICLGVCDCQTPKIQNVVVFERNDEIGLFPPGYPQNTIPLARGVDWRVPLCQCASSVHGVTLPVSVSCCQLLVS